VWRNSGADATGTQKQVALLFKNSFGQDTSPFPNELGKEKGNNAKRKKSPPE
jgi:hypothetical protein